MCMNLYYLIPSFLIVLLLLPVFVKVRASYNVLENMGAIGFFIFGTKITSLKFKISGLSIKIYKENNGKKFQRFKEEKIDFESEEAVFIENLIKDLKDKIRLKYLQVHYNLGVSDAFKTAMLCGYVNSFLLTVFTRIKCTKPTASFFLGDIPSFNQTVFQFAFGLKISITFFDVVYSLIKSAILTLKTE